MCNAVTDQAPRGMRYHIALAGRRNAGKSSLLNLLTGQDVSIVSDTAGTTTDAVNKPFELLPLGPVTFIDTAGIDDEGELGNLRVAATRKALNRADMALYVVDELGLTEADRAFIESQRNLGLPVLVVFNKGDLASPSADDLIWCDAQGLPFQQASSVAGHGRRSICQALFELAPEELKAKPVLAADCYGPGDTVVCVVPIDMAAPKGRLILPQVQILREALDHSAIAMICKETELAQTLAMLPEPPALVVTDAQAIKTVAPLVPESVPLTTFSSLFARFKGDLAQMVEGAAALDRLKDGDRVLIAEACSHHVQDEDIGRVKLPALVRRYSGKQIEFDVVAGHDFPDDLESYALVLHCGACMFNRAEMLRRLRECTRRGVPITNYGVAIAKLQGVMPRVVAPLLARAG
ncbi:[FeFe] hydrogenase H-cluster maturation GTPase HydF [Ferrimonas balearica]|uniref:[FeFe] hydrogenase H-cluster maturation GTPase HydF n=1 Tax=Ferrimonas balearica TaxID=44012 RepID=UPI001C9915E5|nr:[FeFe] hydrogenase H-cluster maturation GTPase HydF [Ferrimonas balearica]MBY5920252.1 [FeFe] hydrogenase H-cluster maturation GTPase HydF [Ferrimonas balearica]MBY5997063.1 [FeFe] hydrogenase H-cluster maturation GTPase HydF [Ferrimonas balearica]